MDEIGARLPLWTVAPFAGLLLSIALLPLRAPHWWERRRNQAAVAALWAVPIGLYLAALHGPAVLGHTAVEYLSFICLVGSLYVVSGNLYLTGNLKGTPRTNVFFLIAGSALANIIGTAGASVVLIRPLLRANSERRHVRHVVVFFIFSVSNCGGLLTPLGDPPLFLGFLRGVPFFWTAALLPQWLVVITGVVATFYALERRAYAKETAADLADDAADYVPLGLAGKPNLVLLAAIVASVLFAPLGLREAVMVAATLASLRLTDQGPRAANKFTFGPIEEVAVLFAGIFVTMVPALAILEARGDELGLTAPWHFFWVTGLLSSFLDNAPTYLTFTSTAAGYLRDLHPANAGVSAENLATVIAAVGPDGAPGFGARILQAISCGAVMMGANSYIGNAPNFLVKGIAEEAGIPMPSFFGYMVYSFLVLVPTFVLVTVVFFR